MTSSETPGRTRWYTLVHRHSKQVTSILAPRGLGVGGKDAAQVTYTVAGISNELPPASEARCQLTLTGSTNRRHDIRQAHFIATAAARYAGAIFAAIPMFAMVPAAARAAEGKPLGHAPLCEASAALIVDCPGSSGSCLLVGDNERKNSLFWFRLDGTPLEDAKQQQLQFKGGKIDDIEALARLRNGRIIAFGSYSRTTKCEDRPDRRRFGVIDQPAKESAALWVSKPTPIDCDALFGKNRPRRSVIEAACSAIEGAGRAADNAANDETKCNQAHAYNAEGAVNVSRTEVPDIWIGLRAPLLPKHPNDDERRNLAMLLHLKSLDQYAFDRVALLDLGGRGVRDLAYTDDGVVWVIAGPPQDLGKKKAEETLRDGKGPFRLMRFRAEELNANKIILPEEHQTEDLPHSSEGLAVFGDRIFVLMDGDKPSKGDERCKTPAHYLIVPRSPTAQR